MGSGRGWLVVGRVVLGEPVVCSPEGASRAEALGIAGGPHPTPISPTGTPNGCRASQSREMADLQAHGLRPWGRSAKRVHTGKARGLAPRTFHNIEMHGNGNSGLAPWPTLGRPVGAADMRARSRLLRREAVPSGRPPNSVRKRSRSLARLPSTRKRGGARHGLAPTPDSLPASNNNNHVAVP